MAIRYIGNCEWDSLTPVEWTHIDRWGAHQAHVSFTGRSDKEKAFTTELQRFGHLQEFPKVFVQSIAVNQSKPWAPIIDINFVGFRDGIIPPAKAVDTSSVQLAPFIGGGQLIIYAASRTVWTWFELTKPNPKTPRYRTVQDPVDPFLRITNGIRVTTDLRALYRKAFTKISDYNREELAKDRLWACSCTADYVVGEPA